MLFIRNRDLKWNISVRKITVVQHIQASFLDTLEINNERVNKSSQVLKRFKSKTASVMTK